MATRTVHDSGTTVSGTGRRSRRTTQDALPNLQLQGRRTSGSCSSGFRPRARRRIGLEALLREVFPIESYDGTMFLEYIYYELEEPRYTPDECRELRLTYGLPFRSACACAARPTRTSPRRTSTSASSRS
jgi:DNA-directed RNA polymerase beta subunit